MPPRPALKLKPNRPSSAIYLGTAPNLASYNPTLSGLTSDNTPPDLPEPPSPVASNTSDGSGLPSPPATNSTGSGSTGDPGSIAIRKRPISLNSLSSDSSSGGHYGGSLASTGTINNLMQNAQSTGTAPTAKTPHRTGSRSSSRLARHPEDADDDDGFDDIDDVEANDNDEDNTARLDRRQSLKSSSENVMALQRVKSLAQRNRMVLDKLSSISRLSSPTPSHHANARTSTPISNSRSPVPPSSHSSSSSSHASSSRLSQPQSRHISRPPPVEHTRSGSETEREGSASHYTHTSSSSSSHLHSAISLTHSNSQSSSHTSFSNSSSNDRFSGRSTPPNGVPHRIRLTSAPASPNKARLVSISSTSDSARSTNSHSPSRRRKRASMASTLAEYEEGEPLASPAPSHAHSHSYSDERAYDSIKDRDGDRDALARAGDITRSALAAVASSRRSPVGTRRTRGALPKEFREGSAGDGVSAANTNGRRGSWDAQNGGGTGRGGRVSTEPMTPHRSGGHHHNSSVQYSPQKGFSGGGPGTSGRSSTVRERRFAGQGQARWASEDLTAHTSTSSSSALDRERQYEDRENARRERRQSLRGGSADSVLALGAGGRSLVGEGLRAAGLQKREVAGGDVFRVENGTAAAGGTRERRVEWSAQPESPEDMPPRERDARMRGGAGPRAATSMADYRYSDRNGGREEEEEKEGFRTAPILRGHQSAFSLLPGDDRRERPSSRLDRDSSLTRDRERSLSRLSRDRELPGDRAGSSLSRHNTVPSHAAQALALERYSSPFGTRKSTPVGGNGNPSHVPPSSATGSGKGPGGRDSQPQAEHSRLMVESLAMFEGHISRVPQLGGGGGGSQADLARSAQGIVHAAERLNGLLRSGTARALEEQIDAEVDSADDAGRGGMELVEVWRKVGGDYREGLRVSDELIRNITGLLLSVGRVVKEFVTSGGNESGSAHGRSMSLDEEGLARTRGNAGSDHGSGSGRKSVESRRSWDLPRDDVLRRLSTRADSALGHRPPSAFNTLRERDLERHETPPPAPPSKTGPRASTGSMRRLFTPREQREQQMLNGDSGAQDINDSPQTPYGYEPSPTPASRYPQTANLDRSRTLPPLAIPKPLPTLPSESLLRRNATANGTKPNSNRDRRQVSIASISTVRATPSFTPLTTPINPTTAVTPHTVSNSPDRMHFPLLRTDSNKSARSNVTFSRPSTVSVSALSGLQQQDIHRKRTISGTSSGAEPSSSAPAGLARAAQNTAPVTPLSGSETERDTRRRTVGYRTMRMSLDSAEVGETGGSGETGPGKATNNNTVHAADRSAAFAMLPPQNSIRRERRRTVTDIWPRE